MVFYIFSGIFIVYLIISLIILPFQYRFLITLKEEEKKHKLIGKTQGEMYDEMDAGKLVLHENMQGNPLFFLANILAAIIYRIKHPKKKTINI